MIARPGHRLLVELPHGMPPNAEPPGWSLCSVHRSRPRLRVAVPRSTGQLEHPWDEAHRAVRKPALIGLEGVAGPAYAKPDFVQSWPFPRPDSGGLESFTGSPCEDRSPDAFWSESATLPSAGTWTKGTPNSRPLESALGDSGNGRHAGSAFWTPATIRPIPPCHSTCAPTSSGISWTRVPEGCNRPRKALPGEYSGPRHRNPGPARRTANCHSGRPVQ